MCWSGSTSAVPPRAVMSWASGVRTHFLHFNPIHSPQHNDVIYRDPLLSCKRVMSHSCAIAMHIFSQYEPTDTPNWLSQCHFPAADCALHWKYMRLSACCAIIHGAFQDNTQVVTLCVAHRPRSCMQQKAALDLHSPHVLQASLGQTAFIKEARRPT